MSDPRAADADPKDSAVAKTAGIVVFSGIALSILKAINPLNRNRNETHPFSEPTQPIQMPTSQPPPKPEEPIFKMSYEKPISCIDQNVPEEKINVPEEAPESSQRTVKIVKGDTLWGLSRKYGVSIDAIKEANGLKGDTIYAGKKLRIP
nr:probable endopeptidase p60 isoform X1 [Ziziphus jujuba var. spinosa]XP_048328116.1 probable endopeptidase p60 isoform X1 [Ziziphus jujuba var. spinosa]